MKGKCALRSGAWHGTRGTAPRSYHAPGRFGRCPLHNFDMQDFYGGRGAPAGLAKKPTEQGFRNTPYRRIGLIGGLIITPLIHELGIVLVR